MMHGCLCHYLDSFLTVGLKKFLDKLLHHAIRKHEKNGNSVCRAVDFVSLICSQVLIFLIWVTILISFPLDDWDGEGGLPFNV